MRREALPPGLQEKRLWPAVQQMRQSTRRQVREDRWAHVPSKLLHLRKVQGISSSPVPFCFSHTHALYPVVLHRKCWRAAMWKRAVKSIAKVVASEDNVYIRELEISYYRFFIYLGSGVSACDTADFGLLLLWLLPTRAKCFFSFLLFEGEPKRRTSDTQHHKPGWNFFVRDFLPFARPSR